MVTPTLWIAVSPTRRARSSRAAIVVRPFRDERGEGRIVQNEMLDDEPVRLDADARSGGRR
jgi:hypothetical protein